MTGIQDLPTPVPALFGWPWTQDGAVLPPALSGKQEWPRISIVTPSLNQGEFLERTIRSVLLQRYPNLEYIIIDGGSTDGSREIISKYSQHLSYHISEPDRGYVHAINKGFEIATGEIICWLNSDDYYFPGTLATIAEKLARQTGHMAAVGHVMKEYVDGRAPQKLVGQYSSRLRLLKFWHGYHMHQPAIFWRREVFDVVGYLAESRDLIADFDYWARIAEKFKFENIDEVLAGVTYHSRAKTGDNYRRYYEQLKSQAKSYWGSPLLPDYWFLTASSFRNHYLRHVYYALKFRLGHGLLRKEHLG